MGAVSLRLPGDVAQRLHRLAERTGRSKTFYMIEAARAHLDNLEDLYLAEQRLAANRAGTSATFTLDEVEDAAASAITISLPAPLRAFMDAEVAAKGHGDVGEAEGAVGRAAAG